MKSLDEIWKEYIDMNNNLSLKGIAFLNQHIAGNDSKRAIHAATDMINESLSPKLMKSMLIPSIAEQLDNEDSSIRIAAIESLIGRLEVPQYANKSFYLARYDPDEEVRQAATGNIGYVINEVGKKLAQAIALYLYEVIVNEKYDCMNNDDYEEMRDFYDEYGCILKDCAVRSINNAMGVLPSKQFSHDFIFNEVWKSFVEEFHLGPENDKLSHIQTTTFGENENEKQVNPWEEKKQKFDNIKKVQNVQNGLKNVIKRLIKSLRFCELTSLERKAAEEALFEAKQMLHDIEEVVPYIPRKLEDKPVFRG